MPNLIQTVLGFGDVALEVLNHLDAKLLRRLLSRNGTSLLRAGLGDHSHVHTTRRRGLHTSSLGDRHDLNPL